MLGLVIMNTPTRFVELGLEVTEVDQATIVAVESEPSQNPQSPRLRGSCREHCRESRPGCAARLGRESRPRLRAIAVNSPWAPAAGLKAHCVEARNFGQHVLQVE